MRFLYLVVFTHGLAFGLENNVRGLRHCNRLKDTNNFESVSYAERLTQSKYSLIFILFLGLLFFLLFLGMIKGLIGLFCIPKVGTYGLDLLIDLPRPLGRYQENSLRNRKVVYDIEGWPLHPDTRQKSVRVVPMRTEFCLNLIFFLAYPLAVLVFCCSVCCCVKNYKGKEQNECFKNVNVIRLTEMLKNGARKSPDVIDVYTEEYKEAQDTKYVLNAMKKSKEGLNKGQKGSQKACCFNENL